MLLYRICKRQYAHGLSGTGAGLYGGRWNPPGLNMLYTAGSISLACLEYLAHNYHVLSSQDICLVKIEFSSGEFVDTMGPGDLPEDWRVVSYIPAETQRLGQQFIMDAENYILKVPSVIVPDEYNYLLNPAHPAHRETTVKQLICPFRFDERLFGK